MQKRILMLGASPFQIPPIKYAKEQGHYAITCDYLPDNPGHRYSDEYHNVSTTDLEQVLELARTLKIDGIVAYASDPAAPTAAYVAEKLGLPTNPYESVLLLSRKDMYRKFLKENGFATPRAGSFDTLESAQESSSTFCFPVVVKPVDSSGSKGVSVVYEESQLSSAYAAALKYSRAKKVLLEEYVEKDGYQIAGDGFVYDGQLKFRCFANEHFDLDCNPLVPIGESFPYIGDEQTHGRMHDEVQRLLTMLNMRQGALNFDIRLDTRGDVHLMEIGPRNGGNLIPEVTHHITGIDMVKYTVDAALGLDCKDLQMQPTRGYYSSYIVHSQRDGVVKRIERTDDVASKIVFEDVWTKPGDKVQRFDGSNQTLGTMILQYDSPDQMLDYMDNMNEHIIVQVE